MKGREKRLLPWNYLEMQHSGLELPVEGGIPYLGLERILLGQAVEPAWQPHKLFMVEC